MFLFISHRKDNVFINTPLSPKSVKRMLERKYPPASANAGNYFNLMIMLVSYQPIKIFLT